jgi:predicted flap endonuclease-1-like 5' DNA nuclease
MGFLLAKILFLLGVAAVCGAWFAYWWFRRHYQDVSLLDAQSREELATWRARFEERLAARPEVDLQPLLAQLTNLDGAVRDLNLAQPDLAPLQTRLDDMERRLSEMRTPESATALQLESLSQRLDSLEAAVRALVMPEMPPAPDLTPVERRLMAIEHSLFPVQTRLDELESAIRGLRVPAAQPPDLTPLLERLDALQSQLENPSPPKAAGREGPRNRLTHPGHGKPDDLTQIKGVPKVLEHRLHKVGVFYFWQIAEWSPEDVKYVDSQLTAHQGCIERDDWVSQANELASTPSAAHRPLEH